LQITSPTPWLVQFPSTEVLHISWGCQNFPYDSKGLFLLLAL
jgi:hypothetical protein